VEGARAVTDFCQAEKLPLPDRVRLFQQVCEAVAHAHQRGIIHRDLKPSNILVSEGGQPKVIDFGIARATEQVLARSTLVTIAGQVLGTPAYMSPEQAAGRSGDVDTRSDLYSLGAVLHEILSGQPLFPRQKLESSSIQEALRMVREEAPVKPSSHNPELKGELEWIVIKAVEKEPARRYETAAALARDLGHWLNGGTVLAAPPSRRYRLRMLLRRHRTAAWLGGALLLALIGGTIGMTVLWLRAQQAARAESFQRQRAEGELWQSLVTTAQRERGSQSAGSVARAMETVRRAAAIKPGVELRDEAIAALVKADFIPQRSVSWQGKLPQGLAQDPIFHPDMSSACLVRKDGSMVLVETETCRELRRFEGVPFVAKWSQGPWFSTTGAWLVVLDPEALAEAGSGAFLNSIPGKILTEAAGSGFAGRLAGRAASVLTASCNLRLWSVADGRERRLRLPPGVTHFLWNADDSVLVLLRTDSIERLAMPEGRSRGRLAITPGWRGPALAGDGNRIAVGYDRKLEIRQLPEGTLLHTLTHQQTVENTTWNEDGSLVAVGAHDSRVHVWDTATGLKWAECNGHDSRPAAQEFLPGSGLLLTSSWDNTMRIWNPRTGRPLLTLPANDVMWVRNSAGHVVSTSQWPVLGISKVRDSGILRMARQPGRPDEGELVTQDLAFSQDGRVLFAAGRRGVDAWETGSLRHLGGWAKDYSVSVMPEAGSSILVSHARRVERVPWTWQPGDKAMRFGAPVAAGPASSTNHADLRNGLLAVSCVSGKTPFGERVEIWRDGVLERGWDFLPNPKSAGASFLTGWPAVALSPDGRWLATGGNGRCRPLLLRTDEGPLEDAGHVRLGEGFHQGAYPAFSPDSRLLAIQSLLTVSLWEVPSRTLLHRLARPAGSLGYLAAFSPDGRLLATLGPRYDLWLIDPATGQRLAALTPPEPAMTGAICFSPDNSLLAAALMDGTVQVWDLRALRQALALENLDWK
jgi:WD40 repeat protein